MKRAGKGFTLAHIEHRAIRLEGGPTRVVQSVPARRRVAGTSASVRQRGAMEVTDLRTRSYRGSWGRGRPGVQEHVGPGRRRRGPAADGVRQDVFRLWNALGGLDEVAHMIHAVGGAATGHHGTSRCRDAPHRNIIAGGEAEEAPRRRWPYGTSYCTEHLPEHHEAPLLKADLAWRAATLSEVRVDRAAPEEPAGARRTSS